PKGFRTILNLLMMFFSGNILPLTLFPESWQRILTLFPYAQILDAPIRLYSGQYSPAEAPWILLLQAVWTIALIAAGCLLWNLNQKKLVIQGG
ncbi:MAG: ABC-2 family transporter protein, partial [bacterium]